MERRNRERGREGKGKGELGRERKRGKLEE